MRPCISSLRDHAAHVQICSRQICRTQGPNRDLSLRQIQKNPQIYRSGFNQILPCICHCVRLRRCQSFPTIGRTARLLIPTQLRINEKAPANYAGAFSFIWRRERDSNPRYAINVYTLSRRAPSATQPSLQIFVFFRRLSKLLTINQLRFGPRHTGFIHNPWVQRST